MPMTLEYTGELTVLTCWCGMAHAVPSELRRFQLRQKDDGEDHAIYCPLGHAHVPLGTSKWKIEQERAAAAQARAQAIQDQLDSETRSHSATKGQLTKMRKRAASGVCPCCSRTFKQVRRHMVAQHPTEAALVYDNPGLAVRSGRTEQEKRS